MRTRWWPVLLLLVLAPTCAEYLTAYDTSTGHPGQLIGNLIVFSPLYGAPALLVREVARRRGLGWPSILLLATAFGITQAGLVDQSMWSTNYRDIPYWSQISLPTLIAPIGLSAYLAITFVGGHVVNSIGAPIAVVEGLAGSRGRQPWLGRVTLVVVALLYAAASGLVLQDTYATESDHASPGQLVGSALAVVLVVTLALRTPWRRTGSPVPADRTVPAPRWLAVGAALAMVASQLVGAGRIATAAVAVAVVAAVVALVRLGRRPGWSAAHATALATGGLLGTAAVGFLADPLGDVGAVPRYLHSAVLLALVVGLGWWGVARAPVALPSVEPMTEQR